MSEKTQPEQPQGPQAIRPHGLYARFSPDMRTILDSRRGELEGFRLDSALDHTLGIRGLTTGDPRVQELEKEISQLKEQIRERTQRLAEKELSAAQKDTETTELKEQVQILEQKQALNHLLTRVGEPAQRKLLESEEFRALFNRDALCDAFVLSIDIRRSTELMLKAREPKLFAHFITELARKLRQTILDHSGIFDKFTGDGILAFFPTFYSGDDAGYLAVKAASSCHDFFEKHYQMSRRCFVSVLRDAGLGIGLDYGSVEIVQIGGEFTVVGSPVVYACRMAGAPAGHVYLNQAAFEQVFERYSAYCDFAEAEIDIKHEGLTLAYKVSRN